MKRENIVYALALIGALIGIYLTVAHYYSSILVCPKSGAINCESVTTSQYSDILGIPLSVLAVVLFLLAPHMVAKHDDTKTFLWSIAGFGAVAYSLGSQSLLAMVCIFCVALDILIIALIVTAYTKRG